ncbi:MAG: hypothetical protein QNJ98_07205 [Planctomycetota bacterium]|nr:hypothetical protein [Planctomycetota bacterium]
MRAPRSLQPCLTCVLASLAIALSACGGGGGGGPAPVQVIQVTNLNNAGPGSLRDAVENAPPGAWITFDPTLAVGTITLQSPIAIDQPRVIGGLSGTLQRFTISGGDATRLFDVASGAALDLRDFILREGRSVDSGAAIRALNASIALSRVQVFDCTSEMGGGGGLHMGGGVLAIHDCAFTLNSSWSGGAISARETTALIEQTSFYLNASNAVSAYGGALSLRSVNWRMVNCTFDSNTSTGGISSQGGAIYVRSSGIGGPSMLWLHACTLTRNEADEGGAVFVSQQDGETATLALHASILATNGGAGIDDGQLEGGADVSGSHNLIGVNFGGLFHGVNGNQVGDAFTPLDPDLEAVTTHTGGRLMRRPANGSPAVDAIPAGIIHDPNGALLTEDQRGIERSPALPADVGAIER